jgi:hypothetical protein|nr:MAG TPA: YopX protein [Caudoviricetes sp.]
MKQPKVYVKKYDKIFDVIEIHFDINVVYFDDGISNEYMSVDFDEVEFIYGTGIKDKNGKEIEHGDILKTEFAGILPIKFHNVYGFYAVKKDDKYWFAEETEDEVNETLSKTEVIGNIYENEDLLED